ncbi:cytochrome c oxidase subunit VIa-domain-containing protein [Phlyctochytrium arcticum]|nr:cytochrome c oxidase subunit VIa-domain-containing protein [Phlyctochytrium arcticum]
MSLINPLIRATTQKVSEPVHAYAKHLPPMKKMMLPETYQAHVHAHHAVKQWTRINLFLVIPALMLVGIYTIPSEMAHIEHIKKHPREFEGYWHVRKRKNPFPWGDDNLFYNPNSNPRPPSTEE